MYGICSPSCYFTEKFTTKKAWGSCTENSKGSLLTTFTKLCNIWYIAHFTSFRIVLLTKAAVAEFSPRDFERNRQFHQLAGFMNYRIIRIFLELKFEFTCGQIEGVEIITGKLSTKKMGAV